MFDIWIDLDKTIWNSYFDNDNECWAKQLNGPFTKINDLEVKSKNGKCVLHTGFMDWIFLTKRTCKSINIISAGGRKGVSHDLQPSVNILRAFGLLNLFDNVVLKYKSLDKGKYLQDLHNKNILFIDDDILQLTSARNRSINSVDRADFKLWKHFQN